jgi:AhpD family alkylhydroperoxidase
MKNSFNVPQRNEVSEKNQKLFDEMQTAMHQVPNLYATFAYSENALGAYLAAENAPTALSPREVETVNLAVSQVNNCVYCLSAHRLVAKANGFKEQEVAELRAGKASFDPKLNILSQLAKNIAEQRGHIDPTLLDSFFAAGYTKENLVDTIMLIGIRSITNFQHAITKVPVDFTLAPLLENS